MAICPHCQTTGEKTYSPCPQDDGYFLVEEKDYQSYSSDPWLGRRIGDRFVISSILGQGSMGHVYKAYQEQVDRMVAIKIFETEKVGSLGGGGDSGPNSKQRFVQEARVLAKLSHPNCVILYDFGLSEKEDFLYIAMEHVGGISLRRAVRRGVKMEAIVEVVRQILMALREAHALDIVHRDLKPENIILSYRRTSDEQIVKVLDFGIAKLLHSDAMGRTAVGLLFGTPAYMSPEQCRGEPDVTPATDIYALGCMIFEMVTGHLPFDAARPREMVRLHQEEPVPAMIPRSGTKLLPGLEDFVRKCMAKNAADRFANAAVALTAFEKIVGGEAKAGQLARGLARLDDEKIARRVSVPKNSVTGAELDPMGERGRPAVADPTPVKSKSVEVNSSSQTRERVTDTLRGQNGLVSIPGAFGKPSKGGGRNLLVLAAVLMVFLFCALLFAAIYLAIRT